MRAPRWLYPVRHPLAWLRDRGYVVTRDGVVRGRLAGSVVILIDDIASYLRLWAGQLAGVRFTAHDRALLASKIGWPLVRRQTHRRDLDLMVEVIADLTKDRPCPHCGHLLTVAGRRRGTTRPGPAGPPTCPGPERS